MGHRFATGSTPSCANGAKVPRCQGGWHLGTLRGRSPISAAVGPGPKDGTVRRVVDRLEDQGILYRGDDNRWDALGAFYHTNGNGNGGAS